MIKRFVFLLTIQLAILPFLAAISCAEHVAVIKSADIKPYNEALEGFESSCTSKVTEIALQENQPSDIAREIIRINADGVLAIGMDALIHLQNLTDVPIVYTMIPDPRSSGVVRENVSGVNMTVSPERYLGSMLDLFPSAKRIGLIYDPRNSGLFVEQALNYARSRDIELVLKKAVKPADVPSLMEAMKKVDVFWMLPDPAVINNESVKFIFLFSFQNKIPVFTFSKKYVEMGAIAGLNISPFEMGAQACELLKKSIAERGNGSSTRVDAGKAELVVNVKVAKKMGIKIRDEVLRRSEGVN